MKYLRTFEEHEGDDEENDEFLKDKKKFRGEYDQDDDSDSESGEEGTSPNPKNYVWHNGELVRRSELPGREKQDRVNHSVRSRTELVEEKKKAKGLPPWLKKGKKKDAECDPKEEKCDPKEKKATGKGLTAAQKKLPAGLQKAILAKKK